MPQSENSMCAVFSLEKLRGFSLKHFIIFHYDLINLHFITLGKKMSDFTWKFLGNFLHDYKETEYNIELND